MRSLLLALALAANTSALAAGLQFTPYPNQIFAGQPVKITLLINNPNSQPATFNTATCPLTTLQAQSGEAPAAWNPDCPGHTENVVIPSAGKYAYTLTLPALPAGYYKAHIKLNDSVNGYKADLETFFNVRATSQVVQSFDLQPVYLSGEGISLKVVTRNISSKTFSQDIRLCGTDFLIRDRLGKTVYEAPKPQACTGDIRPTTLGPGQQHTEEWGEKIRLPAGKYQVFHWNYFGSAVGSFEVK